MRKILMMVAVLTLLAMAAFAGCENKETPAEAPAATNATQGS